MKGAHKFSKQAVIRSLNYKPSVRTVKKIVNRAIDRAIEDKQYVQALSTNFGSVSSAWNEQMLNNLAQGDGEGERIGKRIRIKSVEIKGVAIQGSAESAVDDSYNIMRVVLATWYNKQLTPVATSGLSLENVINKRTGHGLLRTKYLDKYIALNVASTEQGAGDGYAPGCKTFRYYKRFKKPITCFWASDTQDYPNVSLCLSMCSDSGAVVNPGFTGYVKMVYEDA